MTSETKPVSAPATVVLSVPLTHSDWTLRMDLPMDRASIHYMLDQCKACGWSRIYWRLFNGGRTVYPSQLADSQAEWDEDSYWNPLDPEDAKHTYWFDNPKVDREKIFTNLNRLNYTGFDTLAEAIDYGHQIGLEIHAWLTLNEDDHGWGLQSRFTKENPDSRWRKRDGSVYHSQQSFAFEKVREYKLGLIREVLEKYDIDGFFLDWIRTGDVRDDPQNDADGVADFGYEEPLVTSFQEQYGISPYDIPNGDDRWVRWRAEPQTEFMRGVRRLMKATRPELPLTVMGQHPWSYRGNRHGIAGNLRGLLLDTKTWAREGLVDTVIAAGYYLEEGAQEKAYQWLQDETEGRVDVALYGWVYSTTEEFDRDLALVRKYGGQQLLLWEADYIDAFPNKAELQQHMREAVTGE